MLREIISDPIYCILATAFLSFVFYILFCLFSIQSWKILKMICLSSALIGIMGTLNNNKNQFLKTEIYNYKCDIKHDIKKIKYFLENDVKREYVKTEYSPKNFDELQYNQALMCEWSKKYLIHIDSIEKELTTELDTISIHKKIFRPNFNEEDIKEFIRNTSLAYSNIKKLEMLKDEYSSTKVTDFANTFGVLFLIVSIAISAAIIIKE